MNLVLFLLSPERPAPLNSRKHRRQKVSKLCSFITVGFCSNAPAGPDRTENTLSDIGAIAKAILGEKPEGENSCFWNRDLSWLKAIILLLLETETTPSPSHILTTLLNRDEVKLRQQHIQPRFEKMIGNLLSDYHRYNEEEFAKATFVLKDKLSCFDLPSVRRICDGASDFRLQDFNLFGSDSPLLAASVQDKVRRAL